MYAGGSRRQGVKVGTIALEQAQDGFPACNTAFQWIVCIKVLTYCVLTPVKSLDSLKPGNLRQCSAFNTNSFREP